MPAPLLELTRATVLKDGRPALDDVSLTIHEGEHTAILGPNGAGKSVLVGLLTHHERAVVHDDGTPAVRVLGEARWDVSTLRGQLGVVSSALHQRFVAGNSGSGQSPAGPNSRTGSASFQCCHEYSLASASPSARFRTSRRRRSLW